MASSITKHVQHSLHDAIPSLEQGDRLNRGEFERRYGAMRGLKKAELVEGVVYMQSAVRFRSHGRPHHWLVTWIGVYESATPGVCGTDNTSIRLDLDNMPQPDTALFVAPECGGQVTISEDDYIEGAPEFVAEVTSSSVSYDLGDKLNAYRRNGVQEYLVWRVQERAFDWFVLREGNYQSIPPDEHGILKSASFPGLWLDSEAMLAGRLADALSTLQSGLAGEEHASFVDRLRDET